MRKRTAALGTAAFFFAGPGIVAGVIPWLWTWWEFAEPLPYWIVARVVGALLILAGLVVVINAFVRFAVEGLGTPVPVAAPDRLVVGGFYRYVRNPMYVALLAVMVGQALLFGRLDLLIYVAIMWAVTAAFVHWYEEPTLTRRFGADYDTYRRAVPAWFPRLRPWHP